MKSTEYRKKALEHLVWYKRNVIKCNGKGVYRKKTYDHILPEDRGRILNLLEGVPQPPKDFKYHIYAHHLNSSQMMCYNFFMPLLADNTILNILHKVTNFVFPQAADVEHWQFEYEPIKEEGTNFDLYIQLSTGENIHFEIKYTEPEFGTIHFHNPSKYEQKWKEVYTQHLKGSIYFRHLVEDGNDDLEEQKQREFYSNYQINRNLSYIKTNKDYCIFIFPFDSDNLKKQADEVLGSPSSRYLNAAAVDWKQICSVCRAVTENTTLQQHFKNFNDKYLIFS